MEAPAPRAAAPAQPDPRHLAEAPAPRVAPPAQPDPLEKRRALRKALEGKGVPPTIHRAAERAQTEKEVRDILVTLKDQGIWGREAATDATVLKAIEAAVEEVVAGPTTGRWGRMLADTLEKLGVPAVEVAAMRKPTTSAQDVYNLYGKIAADRGKASWVNDGCINQALDGLESAEKGGR
jgi:hypothetical protein